MIKSLLFALMLMFVALPAMTQDLEPIQPESACDRFLGREEQEACFTATREAGDSYVVALCNDQFSNDEFMKCLENSKRFTFDPKKLGSCKNDEYSDQERVDCMNAVGSLRPDNDRKRLPASVKKTKKKKSKSKSK